MLQPRSGSSVGTPAPHTPPSLFCPTLLRRSEPFRCLGIALLSLGLGMGGLRLLLPALPADAAASLLTAHLAGADEPTLFWLSLFLARLPFWLLLALAGLTRFSGGLTTAVLVWRGICDGAVLGLLGFAWQGGLPDLPTALPLGGLTAAATAWCLADLMIRLVQTIAARRMARVEAGPPHPDGRMDPSLRTTLWAYLALSLTALCAILAVCGGYAGWVGMLVS